MSDNIDDLDKDLGVMTCAFFYTEDNTCRDLDAPPPGGFDKNQNIKEQSVDQSASDNQKDPECDDVFDETATDATVFGNAGFRSREPSETHTSDSGSSDMSSPPVASPNTQKPSFAAVYKKHKMANVAELLLKSTRRPDPNNVSFPVTKTMASVPEDGISMTSNNTSNVTPSPIRRKSTTLRRSSRGVLTDLSTRKEDPLLHLVYLDQHDLDLLMATRTHKVPRNHMYATSLSIGLIFGCSLAIILRLFIALFRF
jgi:hypothetical protein